MFGLSLLCASIRMISRTAASGSGLAGSWAGTIPGAVAVADPIAGTVRILRECARIWLSSIRACLEGLQWLVRCLAFLVVLLEWPGL